MNQTIVIDSADLVRPIVEAIDSNKTVEWLALALAILLVAIEVLKVVLQQRRQRHQSKRRMELDLDMETLNHLPYEQKATPTTSSSNLLDTCSGPVGNANDTNSSNTGCK